MKAYKGFMLQELLVAIVILTLILSFNLNNKSLLNKHSKEEAPLIFMGNAINALRDASEDFSTKRLLVFDNVIYYKNPSTNKTTSQSFEDSVSLGTDKGKDLTALVKTDFRIHIDDNNGNSGKIFFKRNGVNEADIMVNFGSYVFDIRNLR